MALLLRQALATRELLQIMVMVEALFLTTPTGGNTATGTGGTEEGLPGRLEQEVTRLELGLRWHWWCWLRLHLAMVAQQLQELAAQLAWSGWYSLYYGGVPSGAGNGVWRVEPLQLQQRKWKFGFGRWTATLAGWSWVEQPEMVESRFNSRSWWCNFRKRWSD